VSGLRDALRAVRYALPGLAGRWLLETDASAVAAAAGRLGRRGFGTTFGYFHGDEGGPAQVMAENLRLIALLRGAGTDSYLSLKAPALGFDRGRVREIAAAAHEVGIAVLFDAHGPALADPTLDLAEWLLADFPATGCALPARWHRSRSDAARFRDTPARLRIVKGEWAETERDSLDHRAAYLALVESLAGRAAPVSIASHDAVLVERVLEVLEGQTPCTLEQLRNLPRHRTVPLARARGLPVRLYLPFGPGWWPYALDKLLARPALVGPLLVGGLAALRPAQWDPATNARNASCEATRSS
jgi:proline dehydrogenase